MKTRQITPEPQALSTRAQTPTPRLKPFIEGQSVDILETARAELKAAEGRYLTEAVRRFPNARLDGQAELLAEIKLRRDLVRALEMLTDASLGLSALLSPRK